MNTVNLHAAAKVCQAMRNGFNRQIPRRRRRYWRRVFEHWADRSTRGRVIATIRFYP